MVFPSLPTAAGIGAQRKPERRWQRRVAEPPLRTLTAEARVREGEEIDAHYVPFSTSENSKASCRQNSGSKRINLSYWVYTDRQTQARSTFLQRGREDHGVRPSY
jgi:hypothetical protein